MASRPARGGRRGAGEGAGASSRSIVGDSNSVSCDAAPSGRAVAGSNTVDSRRRGRRARRRRRIALDGRRLGRLRILRRGGARGDEALGLGQRRSRGRGQRGAAEVAGGLVAVVRLLGQRTGEDGLERLGQVGVALQHGRGRAAVVRVELGEVVVEVERDAAGQRGEQDAAERVDVGAGVDALAARLLGRDVVDRAHERARAGGPEVAWTWRESPKSVR